MKEKKLFCFEKANHANLCCEAKTFISISHRTIKSKVMEMLCLRTIWGIYPAIPPPQLKYIFVRGLKDN
jgi:hypothetical protein